MSRAAVRLATHALRAALAAGALALAAARPATGQEPRPDPRLAAIADAEARSAIAATIAAAERDGLPVEPLVTKALEGVEKQAPPARIAAAVRALARRLAVARDALAPLNSPAELLSGADALAAGVPAPALQAVRSATGGRSAAVSLGVLAQLVARGIPAAKASGAVTTLARRGATQAQLLALQRAVQEDLAVGVPPTAALDLRLRSMVAVLPAPGAPPPPPQTMTRPARP